MNPHFWKLETRAPVLQVAEHSVRVWKEDAVATSCLQTDVVPAPAPGGGPTCSPSPPVLSTSTFTFTRGPRGTSPLPASTCLPGTLPGGRRTAHLQGRRAQWSPCQGHPRRCATCRLDLGSRTVQRGSFLALRPLSSGALPGFSAGSSKAPR